MKGKLWVPPPSIFCLGVVVFDAIDVGSHSAYCECMTNTGGVRKTCQRWNESWQAHELTFSCYQRRAFLGRDRTRGYLIDAINRARNRHAFHVWAYAIMPEHVHLLIWPTCPFYSISGILKSIKQSVARKAIAWLNKYNPEGLKWVETNQPGKPYQFWQDGGGYDRNIRSAIVLRKVMDYIHENPCKRELSATAEEWMWSSAKDWAGLGAGPIPLDKETCLNSLV
jgi:putative transposase